MERLTKRETTEVNGKELVLCNHEESDCNDSCMYGYYCKWQKKANMRLKHYEDLEEQGKLIKLSCKIGDDVYVIYTGMAGKNPIVMSDRFEYKMIPYFGKAVFLSKEDALKELERLKNERN